MIGVVVTELRPVDDARSVAPAPALDLVALDRALEALAAVDARKSRNGKRPVPDDAEQQDGKGDRR